MILEINECITVSNQPHLTLFLIFLTFIKAVSGANASVKIAADLGTKYRKNVLYNLEATKES